MTPFEPNARRTGLAVLVALALVTGFLVASTATGEEYATVGTATDENQAYEIELAEDQRVQLALQDGEADRSPHASFAVYDPDDAFFGAFELEASDTLELIADQEGAWVLFVTETTNSELAIQFAEEDAEDAPSIEEIQVEKTQQVVAEQDEGPLEEELALRIDPQPATARLEAEGAYEGLDASLATEEGPVHMIEDASANETAGARLAEATTVFDPDKLTAGTYHVEATADAFEGELLLVHHEYVREAPEAPSEDEDPLEDVEVVANAHEQEAYRVNASDSQQLVLAVAPGTEADVLVYDDNHTVQHIVTLEGERAADDNQTQRAQAMDVQALELEQNTAVVFVEDVRGDEDAVLVALADDASEDAAEQLEIDQVEVTFEHAQNEARTQQANLTGGMVGLAVHASQESASFDRELTVTGPLGEIAHIQQEAAFLGGAFSSSDEVDQERFSDGTIEVTFAERSLLTQGQTTVEIAHYVP